MNNSLVNPVDMFLEDDPIQERPKISNLLDEPIDIFNEAKPIKVIGYDVNSKRKTFNQIMTKCYNTIKSRRVLNELYEVNDAVVKIQESDFGRNKEVEGLRLMEEKLDSKLFK